MSFDWRAGYPSVRLPVFARNVVATSHPLAAQAGLSLLQRGGNAVDAAIGAAAAMTILGALQQRLGLRRLLHSVGRPEVARPQCLGPRAGRVDVSIIFAKNMARIRCSRRCAAGIR